MHIKALLIVLILVSAGHAQPTSLLGQTILRSGLESAAYAAVDVVEEGNLQQIRGEQPDDAKAMAGFWDGSFWVDGFTWVLGERGTIALARRVGLALLPGGLLANLGAELLSNGATAAYTGQSMPVSELVTRSAVSAVGGAIGSALIPIPILGWAAGTIFADLMYEKLTAPPKRPTLRGAAIL